ncbi:hypothetical protein AtNW77_Chr4g0279661 [Arabidopsis thaliana]
MSEPTESPEEHRPGFFCVYEIYFKGSFIAPTLPTAEFGEFFKIVIEGETLWNSFTLDRFIEANHKLRMSPPGHLLQLPLPPPLPKGTSARTIAARRKTMSKSIVEACEVNISFLQSTVDKKEYSRTLLVDDRSAEGARSAGAYRPTPHREGHSSRSSHKERSPRRDSPRPTSRSGLSSEPIADLIRKKRDRPSRSSSSPKRDKSRARTDRSPRPSSPPRSMGPPPPVTISPSSG